MATRMEADAAAANAARQTGIDKKEEGPTHKKPRVGNADPWWSDSWTSKSDSWELLQHFAPEAKKESVKKYLNDKAKTLGDLNHFLKVPINMVDLVKRVEFSSVDVVEKIVSKLGALQDTVCMLDNRFFGENEAGFPDHGVNMQVQHIDKSLESTRNGLLRPILVTGSSGSGKTTFAGKILPQRIHNENVFKSKKSFTVYVSHGAATNEGRAKNAEEMAEFTRKKIVELVQVECEINIELEQLPIDMSMIVIIDEIELTSDTRCVGKAGNLDTITSYLQNTVKEVQLVLVGTGLDNVTSYVNSNQDTIKIHMQPWGQDPVEWLAKDMGLGKEVQLLDTIRTTPIFLQLGSNARAAYFLVKSLVNFLGYYEKDALVDAVVKEVVLNYIKANNLRDLNSEQRRHVAKCVLGALQRAEKSDPNFHLDCEGYKKIERVCYSLIDTHVECGNLIEGQEFAVSVTPAIAIVLTALMGNISSISPCWSRFERIAALAELQRLFINAELPVPEMSIKRSRKAFPATNAKKHLIVPKLEKDVVLLNGKGSSYADTISTPASTIRFSQFKHAAGSERITLDVEEELAKMGVLRKQWYDENRTDYNQQRFMTKNLISQWKNFSTGAEEQQSTQKASGPLDAESSQNYDLQDGDTRSMYPYGLLLNASDEQDDVDYTEVQWLSEDIQGKKLTKEVPMSNEDKLLLETDVSAVLGESQLIIVFATNSSSFTIKHEGGFDICLRHVDNEGQLIVSEKERRNYLEYLDTILDTKKVNITFQFCS